jgi:hypothetical protein
MKLVNLADLTPGSLPLPEIGQPLAIFLCLFYIMNTITNDMGYRSQSDFEFSISIGFGVTYQFLAHLD